MILCDFTVLERVVALLWVLDSGDFRGEALDERLAKLVLFFDLPHRDDFS